MVQNIFPERSERTKKSARSRPFPNKGYPTTAINGDSIPYPAQKPDCKGSG